MFIEHLLCVYVCVLVRALFPENVISFLFRTSHSAMIRCAAPAEITSPELFRNYLEREAQVDSFKHFQR